MSLNQRSITSHNNRSSNNNNNGVNTNHHHNQQTTAVRQRLRRDANIQVSNGATGGGNQRVTKQQLAKQQQLGITEIDANNNADSSGLSQTMMTAVNGGCNRVPVTILAPSYGVPRKKALLVDGANMPWFGIDIGGSLSKIVFFDPSVASQKELPILKRIRLYLKSAKAYGATGRRDSHLEMPNCVIQKRSGTLHFIRFATSQMPMFLHMAKSKGLANMINRVCATGGGAYKFELDIKRELNIDLSKSDELDSVIHGIHYIDKYNPSECYYLSEPLDDRKCTKFPYDFSRPYPYLVVNIGSGVSLLAVTSPTEYSRISGSSIGGGTFLGLCCLLTGCESFDEAIRLANCGKSTNIDKLVKDIYGGDYPKFGLTGDTVASSFGHMISADKRKLAKREDLARATLVMVTINLGSIARMCALNAGIDRVVFIGNFLRVNQISMKLLSYAMDYWSKGAMKALFLEHEGYFGAVGCLVESTLNCP